MTKKVAIVLGLCAIALIAGCGKKKDDEVAITPTPAVAKTAEATVAPTERPTEGAIITKAPIKGVPVTDTPTPEPTSTPTPTSTPIPAPTNTPKPTPEPEPESVSSDYLPPGGYYANGSGDDSMSMSVSTIDAGSFSFSLSNGRSGTATFEQAGSSSAISRGGSSTLYFDCSSYGVITVSGIDGGSDGNTFWNTDIHQAG